MLKVAIIGCGKIADAHASQIQRIGDCEIVGVCDREELMARQLCERFRLRRHYCDVAELLKHAEPDVVHITTPPQSHFKLATLCLEHGCHVFVEKPFTLDEHEAETLISLAKSKALKMTVGHDLQYSHVARRMRRLIVDGYLGGAPIHMESYYCYNLGGGEYAKALLSDNDHWVRKLPGKMLHNVISHGIARIAEFLAGDSVRVLACGFVSPALTAAGEHELVDELRLIMSDHAQTTAYFTFSSQMKPALNQFRIYGSKNGIVLDQDNEALILLKGKKYKSYAEHFISPLMLANQYVRNTFRNVGTFLGNDFHTKAGMKCLVETFYRSIRDDKAPLPIPYREILLTARIMDEVFGQLKAADVSGQTQRGECDRTQSRLPAASTGGLS